MHRGLDFPYVLGTDVYAIASGTVVNLRENIDNGTPGNSAYGNFVLIQHDQRHYDRVNQQWAYVYSMYLHLSKNSVIPTENQHVNAGQFIAETDSTGDSGGDHLHLQIVIHPEAERELFPFDTLDSGNRSRNPELWLKTYNNNTATAIGKITDPASGDALANKVICGLVKPYGNYTWSQTYSYTWTNPDDILVENWATTDISPGTYHLHAYNYSGPNTPCSGTSFRYLGYYNFVANRITYIGLYPVALPLVRNGFDGWYSSIYVRNNSPVAKAEVNTTYFNVNGTVVAQHFHEIAANGNLTLPSPPSGFDGSAMVVTSEDIAVSVLDKHLTTPVSSSAYLGVDVTRADWKAGILLVHRENSGWNNLISIQNVGLATTFVAVQFKTTSGSNKCSAFGFSLEAYEVARVNTATSNYSCLGAGFVGSAQISNSQGQPLAVTSTQYHKNSSGQSPDTLLETSNAVASGNPVHAPLIQNMNSGYTSGFNLRNEANIPQSATTYFYNPSGTTQSSCTKTYSLNIAGSVTVYPAPTPSNCTTSNILSAMLDPNEGFVSAQVNQIVLNTPKGSDYRAIPSPTTKVG